MSHFPFDILALNPLHMRPTNTWHMIRKYFGEEYHRLFEVCRREESELFHSQVTNRDYEWYLRAI